LDTTAPRPDLGEAHLEAGRHLLVTMRDYPATRRELEIARRTLPNSANLFGLLASVASRQGQWREALEDYQRAATLDPKNVRWIIDTSGVYDFHRQYDEVHDPNPFMMLALTDAALGRTEDALNEKHKAVAMLPEWDPLRRDPRFQKLLSELKPIPIANATHLQLVAPDK
jgi:tetratricopeptide (TPR) repeat protein